jgi:GINS complex subunit 1
MATLGDSSYKLAKEAKRTADLVISPYNDTLVQSICREIRQLHNKAEATVTRMREDNSGEALHDANNMAGVMLHHLTVKRDKRVLFAYHHQRINKLKELSWNVGLKSEYQRSIRNDLGKTEHKFLEEYNGILNVYKQSFMEVDIGGNGGAGLDPPIDLFIEVRVMRNGGEVNTEYGVLNLTMGNQFWVRRTDVEGLIKAGYLKHV